MCTHFVARGFEGESTRGRSSLEFGESLKRRCEIGHVLHVHGGLVVLLNVA